MIWQTKFLSSASVASNFLLNKSISAAFYDLKQKLSQTRLNFYSLKYTLTCPISLGNVYDEHPSGLSANAVKGAANVALSLAITKSNIPSIVRPIPTAGPFTNAIKGFVKLTNAFIKFL